MGDSAQAFYCVLCSEFQLRSSLHAGVVKLADARDSKSRDLYGREGSTPSSGTTILNKFANHVVGRGAAVLRRPTGLRQITRDPASGRVFARDGANPGVHARKSRGRGS